MVLFGLFLCLGVAMAQTEISGTVVSSEDGEPVVGASILVVGTQMVLFPILMVTSIYRFQRVRIS